MLAVVAIAWQNQDEAAPQEILPKNIAKNYYVSTNAVQFPANTVGFTTNYNLKTTAWHWEYTAAMKNGCQKILFENDPVTITGGVISIQLKTYSSDAYCTSPAGYSTVRGAINAAGSSTFKVIMDGKEVFPSS